MRQVLKSFKYILPLAMGAFTVFPLFWMISCAIRRSNELLTSPPRLLPHFMTLENFTHVLTATDMPLYFLNTVIVAATATAMCIVIALPAAYSFARHRYRGKSAAMLAVLLCNMIPQASTLVPLYRAMDGLGLINSKFGISFTHLLCMLPFSILMLRGFVRTIPVTLEESAMIDGCTKPMILVRIIFPICAPGIFATAMYAFMISWEEFTYAMTFSTGKLARTISVGLEMFSSEFKVDWSSILASAVLMTIPILMVFFLVQDNFIKGAVGGALKE